MILAMDTSGGTAVGWRDATSGRTAGYLSENPRGHAETIGPAIAQVLHEAGVTPQQISVVAVGMGPGPFTGLRIGIAAARAFALGRGVSVTALASHDAIALAWYLAGGEGELLVATDARRRERFWTRYSGLDADGLPVVVAGPALAPATELPAAAHAVVDEPISPDTLTELARRAVAAGRVGPAQPVYLRSPDVTLSPAKGVTG